MTLDKLLAALAPLKVDGERWGWRFGRWRMDYFTDSLGPHLFIVSGRRGTYLHDIFVGHVESVRVEARKACIDYRIIEFVAHLTLTESDATVHVGEDAHDEN